jgi:hypothetical protein
MSVMTLTPEQMEHLVEHVPYDVNQMRNALMELPDAQTVLRP